MSFSDDRGSADPQLLALLIDFSAGKVADRQVLLQQIRHSRLLIPVVQAGPGELQGVVFTSKDGRSGLPAFTSIDSLAQWDAGARPMPQAASFLARHCLKEGLDALLIDMASPHRFAVQGIELAIVAAQSDWDSDVAPSG